MASYDSGVQMREKGQSRNGSSREESTPAVPKAFVPSAPTRRRLPPAARRGQIIEAAAAFFAEVGLEGRTRDLSKRLGITQSLLYKYFDSKEALLEAVFEHVYIGRLSPEWPKLLRNRRLSLRDRLTQFYCEYTDAIFTYEWMRIFMFSGLAGEQLNQRYLAHLKETLLEPLLLELQAGCTEPTRPHIEDIWNLHGGIVYLGIRKYIYQMPTPSDVRPEIERAVDRLLLHIGAGDSREPGAVHEI
jgi:AcrR family transcriptional regulator